MSVRITTDVFCDECSKWAHFGVDDRANIRAAQIGAKSVGWTFDRHGDCKCPECNGAPRGSYWKITFQGTSTPTIPRVKPSSAAASGVPPIDGGQG